MQDLTVEARFENIDRITEFVNDWLQGLGCPYKTLVQIDIALDELFSNICRYAYENRIGHATVSLQSIDDNKAVRISIKDDGAPFNPLTSRDPDVTLGIRERGIGGLGIFMVKKTMDDLLYEYRNGQNILTVIKEL